MPLWAISHGPADNALIRTREAIDSLRPALAYVCTAGEWRRLTHVIGPACDATAVTPDQARLAAAALRRFASSERTPALYAELARELADCAERAHHAGQTWSWTTT